MALLKGAAAKGALLATGGSASSVGAWQSYEGWLSSAYLVSSSELVTIEEDRTTGDRKETHNTGRCFRSYFPGAEMSWQTKDDADMPMATLENGPFGDGAGKVDGCLLVDMKHRDTDTQKAIYLATELTLIKGNHGLAIWSNLNNLTKAILQETIHVVRLSKTGNQWKVEKGYRWDSDVYNHLSIHFDQREIANLNGSDNEACSHGGEKKCELFTHKFPPTKTFQYYGSFKSDSSPKDKRIFTKLKLIDKHPTDASHGFLGPENAFDDPSTTDFEDYEYVYEGGIWKSRIAYSTEDVNTAKDNFQNTLKAWFRPFTEAQGSWKDIEKTPTTQARQSQ